MKEDIHINQKHYLGEPPKLNPQRNLAFLIHPRDLEDIRNNYPLCNELSDGELREMTYDIDPRFLGLIDINDEPYGTFAVSFFIPEDMQENRRMVRKFRERIKETAIYVRNQGMEYLSLGALSAALSKYGEDLQDIDGLKSTTGHVITPWTLEKVTSEISRKYSLKNPLISVVGAAGSTGILLARRLNRKGYRLQLNDLSKNMGELERFGEKYLVDGECSYSSNLLDIDNADIVITVTNHTSQLIDIEKVRSGTILIDDAQPWAWDHEVAHKRAIAKKDIFPVEGGLLTFNDGRFKRSGIYTKNMRDPDFYCCLGEGIILRDSKGVVPATIGRNSLNNLEERLYASDLYGMKADEMGMVLAPFQCGTHIYAASELDNISL